MWKTRIAEPKPANGYLRWHGDEAARHAVYANRARLKSGVGPDAMRKRAEMVERSFAHVIGGEIDAETDHHTTRDRIIGRPKQIGLRDATMAEMVDAPQD